MFSLTFLFTLQSAHTEAMFWSGVGVEMSRPAERKFERVAHEPPEDGPSPWPDPRVGHRTTANVRTVQIPFPYIPVHVKSPRVGAVSPRGSLTDVEL